MKFQDLTAQQTTSSLGASYYSPAGNMSVVIGQFNYETLGTKSTITGGVLQVYRQKEQTRPSQSNRVNFGPNPTSDKLFIQIAENLETDIICKIFDMHGKKRSEQKLDASNMYLELKAYEQGVYIIVIFIKNHLPLQFKIIKI